MARQNYKKCVDCVNFLEEGDKKVSCDYEYFENVNSYKALIYVPEMFDCDKYELTPD